MKVLHLSSEKTWRGGEQQIAYLVEELNKLGVDSIVACRIESAFEKYCQSKDIEYSSFPFKNSTDFNTAIGIKELCNAKKIDLVHMHSSKSHGIGFISGLLGNKTPLILSRRVDFEIKRNPLTAWKYNYNKIQKILCVSNKIREVISKAVKNKKKCVTVHSGVDPEKFRGSFNSISLRKKYHINNDQLLIGNTSALADHKDYFTFVDTAEKLLKEQVAAKFLIIGEGPLEKEIKTYVNTKGLAEQIIFTGFFKDIRGILPQLDVFLMTSKEEGLGTSILDAFACKVPVVATAAGGIPEIVQHKQTGMLAPIGNSSLLAEYIMKLIREPELQNTLTEQAYQLLLAEFDKRITAEKTFEIYKEVLSTI